MNPPETETKPRASGADLITQARAEIEEVQPSEAAAELDGGDVALIDVREQHEFEERHIDGAIHVPRGYLETRIEQFVPDRSKRVVLYCASGVRSAFAAKTLAEDLGYEDVASMAGGITLWRDRGLPVVTPRSLTQDQKERYSRHLLVPEIGLEGQLKLLDAKVLLLGAGGLGSPTALYLAAAGVGTLGLIDDDVVEASNLQRQVIHNTERIGMAKTESARIAIEALNPDVKVDRAQRPARLRQRDRAAVRLRRDRRRRRQLPDPLPAQRCLGAAQQAGRLGLDPLLRRADLDLRPLRGPVLPLPLPDPASGRAGAELRRRRACSACCRGSWACCSRSRCSSSSPARDSR